MRTSLDKEILNNYPHHGNSKGDRGTPVPNRQGHYEVGGRNKQKIVKCKLCEHTTTREADLKRHVESIHGGLTHNCCICGLQTRWKASLKRHVKTVHNHGATQPPKIIGCNQCDYKTGYRSHLREHIQRYHDKIIQSCRECGYQTGWKSSLIKHVKRTHNYRETPIIWLPLAKDHQGNEMTEEVGRPFDDPLKCDSPKEEVDSKTTNQPTGRGQKDEINTIHRNTDRYETTQKTKFIMNHRLGHTDEEKEV